MKSRSSDICGLLLCPIMPGKPIIRRPAMRTQRGEAELARRLTEIVRAAPMSAVGVRLEPGDRLHVEAPFGLADLFALRVRPNPWRLSRHFERATASALRRWPELRIEGREAQR